MPFTAHDIDPLAHRLHALLSEQRTFGVRSEAPRHLEHLVEVLMRACNEVRLPVDVGKERVMERVISARAGLVLEVRPVPSSLAATMAEA